MFSASSSSSSSTRNPLLLDSNNLRTLSWEKDIESFLEISKGTEGAACGGVSFTELFSPEIKLNKESSSLISATWTVFWRFAGSLWFCEGFEDFPKGFLRFCETTFSRRDSFSLGSKFTVLLLLFKSLAWSCFFFLFSLWSLIICERWQMFYMPGVNFQGLSFYLTSSGVFHSCDDIFFTLLYLFEVIFINYLIHLIEIKYIIKNMNCKKRKQKLSLLLPH